MNASALAQFALRLPMRWREAVLRRCLAGATEGSGEERFELADGSVQWMTCDARPWSDPDGVVGGIVIVSQDATAPVEARRQAEVGARRAPRRSAGAAERRSGGAAERRLKDAIDAIPAGFDLYDADDRLVVSNAAAEAMYPHTVEARRPGILFEDLLRVGEPGNQDYRVITKCYANQAICEVCDDRCAAHGLH